jgi:hypothetical protein
MSFQRTGKVYEEYDEIREEFLTVGVCPFCKTTNVALDSDTLETSCEHFVSMQWGCGGTIFIFDENGNLGQYD